MFKLTNISLIITTFFVLAQCKAQTETMDEQGKSGIETRADIAENLNNSKIELDKAYNESLTFLKSIDNLDADNYKSFLIESQNGWKIYSEGKCKISGYVSKDAAQGGLPFYNICMIELNNIRTVEIKKWLEDWKLDFKN